MLFIDDYTRMICVSFIKYKSEALECLGKFKASVENQSELKIKYLRSDRGGEFTSREFNEFYEKHGIKRQLSVTITPQ